MHLLDQRLAALGQTAEEPVGLLSRPHEGIAPLVAGFLCSRLRVDADPIGLRPRLVEDPRRFGASIVDGRVGLSIGRFDQTAANRFARRS